MAEFNIFRSGTVQSQNVLFSEYYKDEIRNVNKKDLKKEVDPTFGRKRLFLKYKSVFETSFSNLAKKIPGVQKANIEKYLVDIKANTVVIPVEEREYILKLSKVYDFLAGTDLSYLAHKDFIPFWINFYKDNSYNVEVVGMTKNGAKYYEYFRRTDDIGRYICIDCSNANANTISVFRESRPSFASGSYEPKYEEKWVEVDDLMEDGCKTKVKKTYMTNIWFKNKLLKYCSFINIENLKNLSDYGIGESALKHIEHTDYASCLGNYAAMVAVYNSQKASLKMQQGKERVEGSGLISEINFDDFNVLDNPKYSKFPKGLLQTPDLFYEDDDEIVIGDIIYTIDYETAQLSKQDKYDEYIKQIRKIDKKKAINFIVAMGRPDGSDNRTVVAITRKDINGDDVVKFCTLSQIIQKNLDIKGNFKSYARKSRVDRNLHFIEYVDEIMAKCKPAVANAFPGMRDIKRIYLIGSEKIETTSNAIRTKVGGAKLTSTRKIATGYSAAADTQMKIERTVLPKTSEISSDLTSSKLLNEILDSRDEDTQKAKTTLVNRIKKQVELNKLRRIKDRQEKNLTNKVKGIPEKPINDGKLQASKPTYLSPKEIKEKIDFYKSKLEGKTNIFRDKKKTVRECEKFLKVPFTDKENKTYHYEDSNKDKVESFSRTAFSMLHRGGEDLFYGKRSREFYTSMLNDMCQVEDNNSIKYIKNIKEVLLFDYERQDKEGSELVDEHGKPLSKAQKKALHNEEQKVKLDERETVSIENNQVEDFLDYINSLGSITEIDDKYKVEYVDKEELMFYQREYKSCIAEILKSDVFSKYVLSYSKYLGDLHNFLEPLITRGRKDVILASGFHSETVAIVKPGIPITGDESSFHISFMGICSDKYIDLAVRPNFRTEFVSRSSNEDSLYMTKCCKFGADDLAQWKKLQSKVMGSTIALWDQIGSEGTELKVVEGETSKDVKRSTYLREHQLNLMIASQCSSSDSCKTLDIVRYLYQTMIGDYYDIDQIITERFPSSLTSLPLTYFLKKVLRTMPDWKSNFIAKEERTEDDTVFAKLIFKLPYSGMMTDNLQVYLNEVYYTKATYEKHKPKQHTLESTLETVKNFESKISKKEFDDGKRSSKGYFQYDTKTIFQSGQILRNKLGKVKIDEMKEKQSNERLISHVKTSGVISGQDKYEKKCFKLTDAIIKKTYLLNDASVTLGESVMSLDNYKVIVTQDVKNETKGEREINISDVDGVIFNKIIDRQVSAINRMIDFEDISKKGDEKFYDFQTNNRIVVHKATSLGNIIRTSRDGKKWSTGDNAETLFFTYASVMTGYNYEEVRSMWNSFGGIKIKDLDSIEDRILWYIRNINGRTMISREISEKAMMKTFGNKEATLLNGWPEGYFNALSSLKHCLAYISATIYADKIFKEDFEANSYYLSFGCHSDDSNEDIVSENMEANRVVSNEIMETKALFEININDTKDQMAESLYCIKEYLSFFASGNTIMKPQLKEALSLMSDMNFDNYSTNVKDMTTKLFTALNNNLGNIYYQYAIRELNYEIDSAHRLNKKQKNDMSFLSRQYVPEELFGSFYACPPLVYTLGGKANHGRLYMLSFNVQLLKCCAFPEESFKESNGEGLFDVSMGVKSNNKIAMENAVNDLYIMMESKTYKDLTFEDTVFEDSPELKRMYIIKQMMSRNGRLAYAKGYRTYRTMASRANWKNIKFGETTFKTLADYVEHVMESDVVVVSDEVFENYLFLFNQSKKTIVNFLYNTFKRDKYSVSRTSRSYSEVNRFKFDNYLETELGEFTDLLKDKKNVERDRFEEVVSDYINNRSDIIGQMDGDKVYEMLLKILTSGSESFRYPLASYTKKTEQQSANVVTFICMQMTYVNSEIVLKQDDAEDMEEMLNYSDYSGVSKIMGNRRMSAREEGSDAVTESGNILKTILNFLTTIHLYFNHKKSASLDEVADILDNVTVRCFNNNLSIYRALRLIKDYIAPENYNAYTRCLDKINYLIKCGVISDESAIKDVTIYNYYGELMLKLGEQGDYGIFYNINDKSIILATTKEMCKLYNDELLVACKHRNETGETDKFRSLADYTISNDALKKYLIYRDKLVTSSGTTTNELLSQVELCDSIIEGQVADTRNLSRKINRGNDNDGNNGHIRYTKGHFKLSHKPRTNGISFNYEVVDASEIECSEFTVDLSVHRELDYKYVECENITAIVYKTIRSSTEGEQKDQDIGKSTKDDDDEDSDEDYDPDAIDTILIETLDCQIHYVDNELEPILSNFGELRISDYLVITNERIQDNFLFYGIPSGSKSEKCLVPILSNTKLELFKSCHKHVNENSSKMRTDTRDILRLQLIRKGFTEKVAKDIRSKAKDSKRLVVKYKEKELSRIEEMEEDLLRESAELQTESSSSNSRTVREINAIHSSTTGQIRIVGEEEEDEIDRTHTTRSVYQSIGNMERYKDFLFRYDPRIINIYNELKLTRNIDISVVKAIGSIVLYHLITIYSILDREDETCSASDCKLLALCLYYLDLSDSKYKYSECKGVPIFEDKEFEISMFSNYYLSWCDKISRLALRNDMIHLSKSVASGVVDDFYG